MIPLNQAAEAGTAAAIEQRPGVQPCAPTGLIARLGDKWTVLIIGHLAIAPARRARFSTLKTSVEGISQRMLTLNLRSLERDGLLLRHVFLKCRPASNMS